MRTKYISPRLVQNVGGQEGSSRRMKAPGCGTSPVNRGSFVWYQDKPDGGEYLNWLYLHFIYGYLGADTYYNNPFNPICQLK